jgi:hypothetical protein
MTDIQEEYSVNEYGLITDPGKFEGEPIYIPVFYDFCLESGADEELYDDCETLFSFFKIDGLDTAQHGIPAECAGKVLCLWETEQGFVNHTWFNEIPDSM